MHFDRVLADAQGVGNLLVQLAGDDMRHHLAFAWGEAGITLAEQSRFPDEFALFDGALQRDPHGPEEIDVLDGFGEKIQGAGLDRPHAHGDIAVPGEKHDRQQDTALREALLQFQAVEFRHRDIEHHATERIRLIRRCLLYTSRCV